MDSARRLKAIHDHYMPEFPPEFASKLGSQLGGPGLTWLLDEVDSISGNGRHSYHELSAEDAPEALAALEDFKLAIQAGALLVPDSEAWTSVGSRWSSGARERLALNLADPRGHACHEPSR